jgi:UDP-N-acetylglucosamine--N-acetylmuramyl-(pentapeptide) pyrophosphoryl-undecaprenol N-acetylglucosamine transferase
MKNKCTIFITGGHITPAIALIEALQRRDDISLVFIGRKHAMEGSRVPSFEYKLISEKGIRFFPITAGRHTFPSLFKIPIGIIQALIYCLRIRPSLIVSFGGYVALPVAIAGWACRIPVITHEQTLVAGLANRIIARIATRVCATFPETLTQFAKGKAVYTGLPMREGLFTPPKKSPFVLDKHYPVIYVTGGATGAQSLNRLLFPILPELLKKNTIVHQVGDASLAEAQKIRSGRYIVASYFPLATVSWIFAHAAFVIGRSGANTVMELAALGKVALLVPLPWSGGGEQHENAAWLAGRGGAVVLSQRELTPQILENMMKDVQKNILFFQRRASAFAPKVPRDGTKRMLSEIEHILPAPL